MWGKGTKKKTGNDQALPIFLKYWKPRMKRELEEPIRASGSEKVTGEIHSESAGIPRAGLIC